MLRCVLTQRSWREGKSQRSVSLRLDGERQRQANKWQSNRGFETRDQLTLQQLLQCASD